MRGIGLARLSVLAVGLLLAATPALALGLDPAYPAPPLGPAHAKGVVVWSHGLSLHAEDSLAPTPPYLSVLHAGGWDVMRFDRPRADDRLTPSSRRLVGYVERLKRDGYRRIVLAGQSFGGFLSLMAADKSGQVDAVIATAPAAFGQFDDDSDAWRLNATRLYPLMQAIKRARVMVFYFHDDEFDPGGRGDRSRAILARKGLGYAVIDQPFYLTGHWAASTGLFVRRFGGCIRDFVDANNLRHAFDCMPTWGSAPSAALKLPPELTDLARSEMKGSGSSVIPVSTGSNAASQAIPIWYGFYPNGRELLLAIESEQGDAVHAVYAVGPSVGDKYPAAWARRIGRKVDDGYVFDEPGKNSLRFRWRDDGGLSATWTALDGKARLSAQLRRIDPSSLIHRNAEGDVQPQ